MFPEVLITPSLKRKLQSFIQIFIKYLLQSWTWLMWLSSSSSVRQTMLSTKNYISTLKIKLFFFFPIFSFFWPFIFQCSVTSVWLCNPVDCSAPGSSVHEILQASKWSGLPCPPLRDLPDPGIEHTSLLSLALAGGLFTTSATWEAQ